MTPHLVKEPDYAQLMQQIAARDELAFEIVFRRFVPFVALIAREIVSEPADVDDVIQTTFTYVWVNARSYDRTKASVKSWIGLIGRSRSIDLIRDRNQRGKRESSLDLMLEEGVSLASPVDTEAAAHARILVQRALKNLPPAQKLILELSYFEGLSQTEISSLTGIPLGTVKTRTVMAMRRLRDAIRGPSKIREFAEKVKDSGT